MFAMDWPRLAQQIVSRRVQLGYRNRGSLARTAGLSLRTISDIEMGRRDNFEPATLAALEQALEWAQGSINNILAGGDPAPSNSPLQAPPGNGPDDLEFEIAMIEGSEILSEGQKAAMVREIRRLWHEQLSEREALKARQASERHDQVRAWLTISPKPEGAT